MLELITGAATAILSGGATGLLGVGIQRIFDVWNKAQDLKREQARMDHELAMRDRDAAIMAQEWAQRTKIAATEAASQENIAKTRAAADEAMADAEAFKESYKEPPRYSIGVQVNWFTSAMLVLIDVVRAIVRPGLTLYLCWIATQMYEESRAMLAMLGVQPSATDLLQVYRQIVFTLLYLFTTCVLWWFGTRNKQAAPGAKAA